MTVTINGTSGIVTPEIISSAGPFVVNSSAPDNSVVIDSSGNVGIGTSSPTNGKLVVSGSSVTTAQGISLYGDTLNVRLVAESATAGIGILGTFSNHSQTFYTDSTERMRIDSSGNLLVGTTSEQRPIVSRAPRITAYATNTEGLNTATSDNTYSGWVHTSLDGGTGTHYMGYFENVVGTVMGSITHNGYNASFNTSSDYRLKENIQPMQNALAVVQQLNPVTYSWKSSGDVGQGFIAHELQAVVPDCVTGEKDAVDEEGKPVYQGIDTSFLVATLCKAIQELNAKVTALEEQVVALEAK